MVEVVPVNGVCGAIDYAGSFGQNVSVITSEANTAVKNFSIAFGAEIPQFGFWC